jgi:hypothetical protein
LATCRTRCGAVPAIQQASCGQGRAVPERILGSMSKKELHGCTVLVTGSLPGSDLAWQSRLRVHYGCACGVKHTRGWTEQTMPTCASSQASCVYTYRTAPYSSLLVYLLQLQYHGNYHAAASAPTAVLHCCTARSASKLVRLFALGLAGPNRSRVPTQRPGSLIRLCDWARAAVPSDPSIFVASEICSGSWGGGPARLRARYSMLRSNPWVLEEAITAACSSCIRLFGIDRASQGTVWHGNGSAECGAVRAITACFLTEGDVAALRAAGVNKEATLSAHTMSPGSRGAAAGRRKPCPSPGRCHASCWESIS